MRNCTGGSSYICPFSGARLRFVARTGRLAGQAPRFAATRKAEIARVNGAAPSGHGGYEYYPGGLRDGRKLSMGRRYHH